MMHGAPGVGKGLHKWSQTRDGSELEARGWGLESEAGLQEKVFYLNDHNMDLG